MGYNFADYEDELEPRASSARSGGPPRKHSGIGILDPPFPPKRPPGPIPTTPTPLLFRVFAGLVLVGLAAVILYLLFRVHSVTVQESTYYGTSPIAKLASSSFPRFRNNLLRFPHEK